MSVKTFSSDRYVVDNYSDVTFAGTEKKLPNINESLNENQLFYFTLAENETENIFIIVSKTLIAENHRFKAQAVNPSMPIGDKMEGHCTLSLRN